MICQIFFFRISQSICFRFLNKKYFCFSCHVSVKNFVSRQRWRLARLRLKSCCSFPGFLWTLAAASCSPKAGLVKPRTMSSWLTPTVCGRSEQVHRTSRRGRRWAGLVGIKWNISAFGYWINSLSLRNSTDVCEHPSKRSSPTCVRWHGPVSQEVRVNLMVVPRFLWYGRMTATWEWN